MNKSSRNNPKKWKIKTMRRTGVKLFLVSLTTLGVVYGDILLFTAFLLEQVFELGLRVEL